MDIASLSMALSQANVMQQVSISVTKNAMDVAEVQTQGLIDMMQQASPPSFGHQMDIRA